MTASSLLPVTIHKGKVYFLFGKECPLEDSAKGFSDFGGGVEKGDDLYETALREGGEELTGFLGDGKILEKHIEKHGGVYKLTHNNYHVHIFFLEYDENLPKYYNQNHRFLWDRVDNKYLNKTKLFEKIEIDWFDEKDMRQRRSEFRNFYRNIVDHILSEIPRIKQFIRKTKSKSKTIKSRTKNNRTKRQK
jgi:hypothetical protein